MQLEFNILQVFLALLFIFGGLVFLNLSVRTSRKTSHFDVIYPDEEDYQDRAFQRERDAKRVVMEWRILVLLELISSSIGGYLVMGFFGILFFLVIVLSSHYMNRRRIPRTDYDPLVELSNRIALVDIHGNTSLHNTKNAILGFIQQHELSERKTARLLDYLVRLRIITIEDQSELRASI